MDKIDLISKKLNSFIPGAYYGLLSITFGFLGDLISYLMYPGYNFTKKAVSSLCMGSGGLFFQIGNVFSGIFALFFVIYLGSTFNKEKISENLRRCTVILASISCVSLIFLGAFCGSNPIIALVHGVFAMISWQSGLFYITLFNILILNDSKYHKFLAYFGFLVSFTLTLLMILFYLHILPNLRYLMIILPTLEWINTILVILWYLIISLYMIKKKI
ncbi:MAG: DUF998 domain-containing protein [Candidatus Thorarchaeota archaeon]